MSESIHTFGSGDWHEFESSSHTRGAAQGSPAWIWHFPLLQMSAPSQYKPSSQAVPFGLIALAGQRTVDPVHVSAISHWVSAAARHTVPEDLYTSAGQLMPAPVQYSAASHVPAAALQSTVVAAYLSAGQSFVLPSHLSATSHTPAEGRHTVADVSFLSVQVVLDPVQ